MMSLGTKEVENLINLWAVHRFGCNHLGDVIIEYRSGGGIGTVVMAICGCKKELDITDYASW